VPEILIRFDYGCGSRGASSLISRLGGDIDGLILVVPYVWWQTCMGTDTGHWQNGLNHSNFFYHVTGCYTKHPTIQKTLLKMGDSNIRNM
jgi:hypothetical protein